MTVNHIKYRRGYKYQLAEDYSFRTRIIPDHTIRTEFITLTPNGDAHVHTYYAWDGPSGPTFDTKNAIRGSLEHDVKYQLIRLGLIPYSDKVIADEELRETCEQDGMWSVRAKVWQWAVDKFGRFATVPSSGPAVLIAP